MTEQVARRSDPRRGVVEWLKSGYIEAEIKRALPEHVPVDWFLRCAQTSLLNNPNLANANKESLLRELVAVAQLGLVTDPQLGEAWLIIDRNGQVQRRVGYQGLRKLALQSGQVTSLNAQAVYSGDKCSIALGDSPHVHHEIDLDGDRGAIRGYYAVGKVTGTTEPIVEWMSQKQVDEHRDRYSDASRHPDPKKRGPWSDPLGSVEMGRKTVFRRLAKWLPKSPLLAEALADEDRADMRDITPDATTMLPAPDVDPMDRVVSQARGNGETPPEHPAQPERQAKRSPGRPKKPETIAREIIAELDAVAGEYVSDYLAERQAEIAALPEALQSDIAAAARERQLPQPEPVRYDPETGEVEPEHGDGSSDADDDYQTWLADMHREMAQERPEFLRAKRNQFLRQAQEWGDDATAAVEEAYTARGGAA